MDFINSKSNTSIIIEGSMLSSNAQYNLNIVLNSNQYQIIKGTIYNQNQKPMAGAVIQVTQIDVKNKIKDTLGYSYTDGKGKYLFAIKALPYMKYEMTVYSPLSSL